MNGKGPSGPLFPFAVFLALAGTVWIVVVAAFMEL
jgi:hypothetical protein